MSEDINVRNPNTNHVTQHLPADAPQPAPSPIDMNIISAINASLTPAELNGGGFNSSNGESASLDDDATSASVGGVESKPQSNTDGRSDGFANTPNNVDHQGLERQLPENSDGNHRAGTYSSIDQLANDQQANTNPNREIRKNRVGSNGVEPDSDSDMEVWTKPTVTTVTNAYVAASPAATAGNNTGAANLATVHGPSMKTNSTLQTAAPTPTSSLTSNIHSIYNAHSTNSSSYYSRNVQSLPKPPSHTSTWDCILPPDYFYRILIDAIGNPYTYNRKKITLSLINVWEFTLEGEVSRVHIKKISKDHVGKDGRNGAIFERSGISFDDPALKNNTTNNNNTGEGDGYKGGGKWRIPLGAYHPLMTYLTSLDNTIVEGIPSEQLRAATLGRERFEKDFPTAEELIKRGVGKHVAKSLAPYQRGGVDFILEREGRALLADEMGLGKTVQAIAAMSSYWREWPLLILSPSSARYHWEVEVRQWLSDVDMEDSKKSAKINSDWDGRRLIAPIKTDGQTNKELKKEAVNVMTSGKDKVLRNDGKTKVVIVSYGLIVALINNRKIIPGMFQAIIVDESHALKNKSSKRTISVLPLLRAANRCLLLSGTPALARPSELWPQISVLGGRRKDGREDDSGLWIDEAGFNSKYVRGEMADENASKARLAELHTLLTSTVMIRRMKTDILKNLQPKIREKAYIDLKDINLKNEFHHYMQLLKQGKGVMGKYAREHNNTSIADDQMQQHNATPQDEEVNSKEALHHLYKITGKSKIAKVAFMLKKWLADPTLGKLCIFAHHLDVLDEIARRAGLSNFRDSTTKYIRIDGATLPKTRQEQILSFQSDPAVRVALLGITAAGVAVTLTASSTVWFAELFWTPAIMIQAEDRCHRIGQQARVRCLYFIARGTLDEILWKLIEKKFRDLGEFVEGRENMDIALERELEEEDDDEILKVEDSGDSKKRKAQDVISDFFDLEIAGGAIKDEINDLVHEEEDMLQMKNESEEDELDEEERVSNKPPPANKGAGISPQSGADSSGVIELLEDEENEDTLMTIEQMRQLHRKNGVMSSMKLDRTIRFKNPNFYKMQFFGQRYGFNLLFICGRAVVKEPLHSGTNTGAIIVGIGNHVVRREPFQTIRERMRREILSNASVTLTFVEDQEFTALFTEDIIPRLNAMKNRNRSTGQTSATTPAKKPETVSLLDDD